MSRAADTFAAIFDCDPDDARVRLASAESDAADMLTGARAGGYQGSGDAATVALWLLKAEREEAGK